MKTIQVVLLAAFMAAFSFMASADVYVGMGGDVVHEKGRAYGLLRVDPFHVLKWNDNIGIGAAYLIGDTWQAGLGGIYVKEYEARVGTHENFLIILQRCGHVGCLSLYHISHGAVLGYRENRANGGLNALMFVVGF